jgi:hypothetical protein
MDQQCRSRDVISKIKRIICVLWLICTCMEWLHMCAMTCSCVCLDSFLCVPCPLHMCAITSSFVRYDSFLLSSMTHSYVFHDSFTRVTNTNTVIYIRPTQSIIHVPLQVNRFQKIDLRIVQYKYLLFQAFCSPESDTPHKILRYWVYYSTQLCFRFPPDKFNDLYYRCTSFEQAFRRGWPSNILHDW